MDGRLHAVASEDRALRGGRVHPELAGLGKQSGAGQPPKAPGHLRAAQLDPMPSPRDGPDADAAVAETIARDLVAMAGDPEPHLMAHEVGIVEGHDAAVVRVPAFMVVGTQLHEGHGPTRPRLDDVDAKGLRNGGGDDVGNEQGAGKGEEGDQAGGHPPQPGAEASHGHGIRGQSG